MLSDVRPLRAGVLRRAGASADKPEFLTALNRPASEDAPQVLAKAASNDLFAGTEWRLIEQTLENEKSLTSEVWRTFLILMAIALVLEAILCMPAKKAPVKLPTAGKEATV